MSYDLNRLNGDYFKILAEKQKKDLLRINDELNAAKLSEKALLSELSFKDENYGKMIIELEKKNEELENKIAADYAVIQYYKDLQDVQKNEMLQLGDEINSYNLLLNGLYAELETQRKYMLDLIRNQPPNQEYEHQTANQDTVYWIEENKKIRDSLTFRIGEKTVALIKNPLKIFLTPFWIAGGITKYFKRKNGKREKEKKREKIAQN